MGLLKKFSKISAVRIISTVSLVRASIKFTTKQKLPIRTWLTKIMYKVKTFSSHNCQTIIIELELKVLSNYHLKSKIN